MNYNLTTAATSRVKPQQTPSVEKHAHPPGVVYCVYSIHKISSFEICILQALNMPLIRCTKLFYQGRLSRHITFPSEKSRLESWHGDYMGKATPVWQLSLSYRCHQNPRQTSSVEKHAHPLRVVLLRYILNTLDSQSFEFEICILQALNMPLIRCTNIFFVTPGFKYICFLGLEKKIV